MRMMPNGSHLLAGRDVATGTAEFAASNPHDGEPGTVIYRNADGQAIESAARAARQAVDTLSRASTQRIELLHQIADGLESLGDTLIQQLDAETGLGTPRLTSERARTCGQLRLFADVVAEGSYVAAIIDVPNGQVDVRRMLHTLGPVAVFAASNFPLAFSVAGGDTAAALAAGCPVVVKAHPAHPGSSELVGRVIASALRDVGLPDGAFSLLHGNDHLVGEQLVTNEDISAVAFTGSLKAGRALFDLANRRAVPIPVFAEMGSTNPIVITVPALRERGPEIATGCAESMLLGSGQFCTKPGLLFVPDGPEGQEFTGQLVREFEDRPPGVLLGEHVREGLARQLHETLHLSDVTQIGGTDPVDGAITHPSVLLTTSTDALRDHPQLLQEHFGPVGIVVAYRSRDDLLTALRLLPGSLTGTIHAASDEVAELGDIQAALLDRAGRLIWNGYPTGVEVTHAMQHGGPYPATTDARHTSVGTTAMLRFLRPVAYQNAPEAALPPALRDDNPLSLWRQVNGTLTKEPLHSRQ